MQEQDEILADIIRTMREERGRVGGYDESRFLERMEILGPEVALGVLRKTITTSCIEKLGDLWDERYGELKVFEERFGHTAIPAEWEENPRLGRWASHQRTHRRKGTLSGRRETLLEKIDFVWDIIEYYWSEQFNALRKYKKTHGDCNVPSGFIKDKKLGIKAKTKQSLELKQKNK